MSTPPHDTEEPMARLRELEANLSALQRTLDRTDRLATLGTLLGLVAHEFNNLLTPVLSYSQLALAAPNDTELTRKALQRAAAGAERAGRVATAILALAGEHEASSAANVADCLDEALHCIARDLRYDGITLVQDVPASLTARIDPVAMQHVFLNLILNARNAMKPTGGTLRVRACSTRNTVAIEISDTGRGMSNEVAARFSTAGHAPCDPDGHGLGILACRRFIEASGGTIEAQSMVGKGTTIRISLPETSQSPSIAA